jgi:hypothetical protein
MDVRSAPLKFSADVNDATFHRRGAVSHRFPFDEPLVHLSRCNLRHRRPADRTISEHQPSQISEPDELLYGLIRAFEVPLETVELSYCCKKRILHRRLSLSTRPVPKASVGPTLSIASLQGTRDSVWGGAIRRA